MLTSNTTDEIVPQIQFEDGRRQIGNVCYEDAFVTRELERQIEEIEQSKLSGQSPQLLQFGAGFRQGRRKMMNNVTKPLPNPLTGGLPFCSSKWPQELAENRLFEGFSQEEWEWLRADLSLSQIEERLTAALEYGPAPAHDLVFNILEAARSGWKTGYLRMESARSGWRLRTTKPAPFEVGMHQK